MKHISLISIMILSLIVNGQDVSTHKRDSIFLAHANAYLNKKLDSEFVNKNLKFVHLYFHAGPFVAIYETISTKNLKEGIP